MPPTDLKAEALRIIDESAAQYRDEIRKVVAQILPIIIAIIGASITVASTEFAASRIGDATRMCLFVSSIFLGLSFLVGVLFLILESNKFRADKFAEGIKKIDIADGAGKSREWYLALAELSNRRSFALFNRQTLTPEYKKMFRDALEAEKGNIQAWRVVRNPERFYSSADAVFSEVAKYSFFTTLIFGGIGVFVFFSAMLFSQPAEPASGIPEVQSLGKG